MLPSYLIEMCESPTPYLIGLMRTCKYELLSKYKDAHDMIIIDLDKQKCILDNDEDIQILPESVLKCLKLDLYNISMSKVTSKYEKNIELCRVFLRIFLKTIGNYRDFMVPIENPSSGEKFKFLVRNSIHS